MHLGLTDAFWSFEESVPRTCVNDTTEGTQEHIHLFLTGIKLWNSQVGEMSKSTGEESGSFHLSLRASLFQHIPVFILPEVPYVI